MPPTSLTGLVTCVVAVEEELVEEEVEGLADVGAGLVAIAVGG